MFSKEHYKSTRNLETKQIIFYEKFSSFDRKMDFYLTTSPSASPASSDNLAILQPRTQALTFPRPPCCGGRRVREGKSLGTRLAILLLALTIFSDIFDHNEEISVCYSLVDLMFAFAYNKRTTLGENTVGKCYR